MAVYGISCRVRSFRGLKVSFLQFSPQQHAIKKLQVVTLAASSCGETGIRTLGARKGTTVFETAPIVHSGISPMRERDCKVTHSF